MLKCRNKSFMTCGMCPRSTTTNTREPTVSSITIEQNSYHYRIMKNGIKLHQIARKIRNSKQDKTKVATKIEKRSLKQLEKDLTSEEMNSHQWSGPDCDEKPSKRSWWCHDLIVLPLVSVIDIAEHKETGKWAFRGFKLEIDRSGIETQAWAHTLQVRSPSRTTTTLRFTPSSCGLWIFDTRWRLWEAGTNTASWFVAAGSWYTIYIYYLCKRQLR